MPAPHPNPAAVRRAPARIARVGSWVLASVGAVAAVVALLTAGSDARSAASQVWSPFVLVAGLILVGLVADQDGLFTAAGRRLDRMAPNGFFLFAGAVVLVAVVTAVLNLDTSVVFLTPVLIAAARSRGQDPGPLLIAAILVSNAGSLLLPGSNLTNLIVLGHLHLSGGQFLSRMALPSIGAVVLTGSVIAVAGRRTLATPVPPVVRDTSPAVSPPTTPLRFGSGALAVVAVTALILVLHSPAVPVAGVGVLVILGRLFARREDLSHVLDVLGLPVLIGLFGMATALGTLGRSWSGPSTLLAHLDAVGTAVVAAGSTVVVNNLPAAALLAARVPPHPYALLVGLDIGPNLFVTGSLAWVLWWRTADASDARPPTGRAVLTGLVAVPLSMAAALGLLALTGPL